MYHNSPHGPGLMAAPGFNRSFTDVNGFQQHAMEKPQIYTVRDTYARSRDSANKDRPSTRAYQCTRWR
jgi:hypothetical protein